MTFYLFFYCQFYSTQPTLLKLNGDGKTELQAIAAVEGKLEKNKPRTKAITLHPRNTTRSS